MGDLGMVLGADKGVADYWYEPQGMATLAGIYVSPEGAMKISAVYASVRTIAETLASVPLHMYQRIGDGGGKREARNHPLEDLIARRPNHYQTALEFREMLSAFALLRKFGIAEIRAGDRGPVDQLVPLHPDLVREETLPDGTRRYRYRDPLQSNAERILLDDQVFVLRGPFGKSVLDYARENFGLAMALERAAAALMGRGVRAQGVLQHPKLLSDKARENLRKGLDEYGAGGAKEGRPMLLEEGMEWQSVSITPEQAQFLDSRRFSVADIARWFRVPLHKIGELTRSTNNNIEHQGLEFVTDTMMPWAERWEQAISRDLILAPQTYFAEHNLDGLNRGDLLGRYQAYAIGRQWGWLATNDILRRENMNPIAGGDDDYLTPMNMTTGADGQASVAFAPRPSVQALGYLRVMVRDAAGRSVRKESAAIAKIAERTGGSGAAWTAGIREFYAEHATFVATLLKLGEEDAQAYCAGRLELLAGQASGDDPETERIGQLAALAISRADFALTAEARPQPPAMRIAISAPTTVHPPAVTIAEGAVRVDAPVSVTTPPVQIAEGAVQVEIDGRTTIAAGAVQVAAPTVDVTVPPPLAAGPIRKSIRRDGAGQIDQVIEEPI
jgi:HK97 family phage portal protein